MLFEEFQDGHHPGYWNGTILVILNLYVTPILPIKFQLNLTYGLGGDVVWSISRWLLSVTPMLPIKFWLNPTYGLGDVVWRISKWPLWQPSWISELNDLSNSESPCSQNASYKVSAQSDLQFWRRCKKFEKLMTNDGRRTAMA